MNQRTILAVLVGAAALSVFPAMPRASAQEFLSYWYYQPGSGGTRQPRTGTSGHFVKFAGPTQVGPQSLAPYAGKSINVQTQVPNTYPSGTPGLIYTLAYVSIQGSAEGDITVFAGPTGIFPMTVDVVLPNTPNPQLAVNAYYFLQGGPPCPTGQTCGTAYIDEFGETQGALLSDTFVNVFIPPATTPNAALTQTGNVDGTVSTGNNAVRINADATVPAGGSFDRWVSGVGGTINKNDLNAGRGTTSYALALYSNCPSGYYLNSNGTISQCSVLPASNCSDDEVWNAHLKKCVPSQHCNMTCPSGQHCVAVGFECDCIKCSGGGVPGPANHPM